MRNYILFIINKYIKMRIKLFDNDMRPVLNSAQVYCIYSSKSFESSNTTNSTSFAAHMISSNILIQVYKSDVPYGCRVTITYNKFNFFAADCDLETGKITNFYDRLYPHDYESNQKILRISRRIVEMVIVAKPLSVVNFNAIYRNKLYEKCINYESVIHNLICLFIKKID